MKTPYAIAFQRALIASLIVTGTTIGGLVATGAEARQVLAALIIGVCAQMAVRFLGEGTIDTQNRTTKKIEARLEPIDFDAPYHFSRDNSERHPGQNRTECDICGGIQ